MKNLMILFLLFICTNLMGQLQFNRKFYKDSYFLDNQEITKTKAYQVIEQNGLGKQLLIEARRNDKIRNISWGVFGVTLIVGIADITSRDENEPISGGVAAANALNTISLIAAIITSVKGKKRHRRAVEAFNTVNGKTGFNAKFLLDSNRTGVVFTF